MSEKDVLRDFLDRLLAAGAKGRDFTEQVFIEIEHQVRRDWRGERVYIAADPDIDRRRQAAAEAVAKGLKPADAAKASGMSRKAIYRLLARRAGDAS